MDLNEDITYRGFLLNDAAIVDNIVPGNDVGGGIAGCVVDSVDFSDVDVVQFLEKRSLQDGMDAGDVYLGSRRIRMAGTVYDVSRPLLYDRYFDLRAALSPILAQRDSSIDRGYQPLYFSIPTANEAAYGGPTIDLLVRAMPRATQAVFQRDSLGGDNEDGLAIPWQATFICKDPGIYGAAYQDTSLAAGGTVSGDFQNRGTYLSPLNMLIVVSSAAGSIDLAYGGTTITITVPASTGNRTIRYNGQEKYLTFEEASIELPRMDLLSSTSSTTHPLVVPGTTGNSFVVTFTSVAVQAGSHMWFYESYA